MEYDQRKPNQEIARPDLALAKRVVIKVGTRVVTRKDGRLALPRLYQIVELAADLHREGKEVLLVSSGAIGAGRSALGLEKAPTDDTGRQACAAIGQCRLINLYQNGFSPLGLTVAQVLLTEADFADRIKYLNLRAVLNRLLQDRLIPIINENDVVSSEEIALTERQGKRPVFGDNDKLSALVASKLAAQLLVLLTDVRGVYDRDPNQNQEVELIGRIDNTDGLRAELAKSTSGFGRGGMRSKVEAAYIASRSGCHAIIASGLDFGAARRACLGENEGTWFPATGSMSALRRWIAFATKISGVLELDQGAITALAENGGSLLPAGIQSLQGDFQRGDIVSLVDSQGKTIGRGIIQTDTQGVLASMNGTRLPGTRTLMRHEHLVLEGATQ